MAIEIFVGEVTAALTAHIILKVSGKLAEKTDKLYQKIKEKFGSDSYADQTLKRLEEQPQSEERQVALKVVMTEKMKEDSSFAEEIQRLMEDMKKVSGSNYSFNLGEKSVAIGRNTSNSIIATGDNTKIDTKGLKENE